MGKVLILCAGEAERWNSRVPKQIIPVFNNEQLLARTVRQIRKRMNNYPHVVSHQKCLRSYSTNYIVPSSRRWTCETFLSVRPIWGNDWTMVLLGDVIYTDGLMDTIYRDRDKFRYHFYGTGGEIYAFTFTDNVYMQEACMRVLLDTYSGGRGKIWELYYSLSGKNIPDAGHGYSGDEDDIHYTFVQDGTRDFDTLEDYKQWYRANMLLKGV